MRYTTSTGGVKIVAGFEGTILNLYYDVVGIQTVCTGHVTLKGEDWSSVTREKCEATLGRDLARFEKAVNDAVHVHISQPMFDAMVSLAFNIGEEGFRSSSVVHHLNQGHYTEAAASFVLWRYANVKQKDGTFIKQPILLGRREAEAKLFRSGISDALLGGGYEELPTEELVSLCQDRLFDLRDLLDDRGLPIEDPYAYSEDGRIVVMPPEREEASV